MYWKFDVPCSFSGPIFLCLLHIGILNSVESYKYILPALPETHYTLYDVIILPENTDVVEVSIISMISSTVLANVYLTFDNEYRLGNAYPLQNTSIESGLQIFTSSKTTVVIELATGLLKLPSTDDYGRCYYVFTPTRDLETGHDIHLLIQSTVPDTSIKLCFVHNEVAEMTIDNFTQHSREIPQMVNCTQKKLFIFEKLLFNNISKLQGIEINSDHPISILEGTETCSSTAFRNEEVSDTLEHNASQISWHVLTPYSNWSNQFVLTPSEDRREVKLWIMSFVNVSVTIKYDAEVLRRDIVANTPSSISISNVLGRMVIVTGNDTFSLRCFKSDGQSCRNEQLPLNVVDTNYSERNNSENVTSGYRWVYFENDTKVLVLCPYYINISLHTSNEIIESTEEIHFNINNIFVKIKTFENVIKGLYKISVNDSLEKCDLFYLQTHVRNGDREQSLDKSNDPSIVSSSLSYMLNTSVNDSTFSTNHVTLHNLTDTISTVSSITEAGIVNLSQGTVSPGRRTTDVNSDEENQNKSASFLSEVLISENTIQSPELHKLTKQNTKVNVNFGLNNKVTKDINNANTNKRFKAVVDIIHSNDGRIDKLVPKSDKRNYPMYSYTFDINANYGMEGDGKSPVAIVVSLVSAILAVGAIIFIFLLKDFLSRRQQIRKIRIRPFISYY